MKVLGILLKFFWKVLLICTYILTKAGELLLTTFNNAFKQLLDK
jgi:hypothetical protein